MATDFAQFDEFVRARLGALYRYAVVLTRNPHDAEDLVQEALTRTGAAWAGVRRREDPEAYVRRVMVRLMANRWRRPRRETLVSEAPDRPVADPELERVMSGLDATLAALPARMRAVLTLRYVDGLDDGQIAGVLGCAPATVRSQAARALAKLRMSVTVGEDLYG